MKLDGKSFGCGLLVGAAVAFVIAAILGVVAVASYFAVKQQATELPPAPSIETIPSAGDAAVTEALKPILQEHNVPAIAAAVVTSEGIQYVGVAGFRKRGTEVPVTVDDLWHLGSDAKAMTATLIARLVERGDLEWGMRMADVFPDLADDFHPDMRGVTIKQLLMHRSGLPPNLSLRRYGGDDVQALRRQAVREYLAEPPSHPPGSTKEYSNLGYIIGGAVVEQTLDTTWEDAMREELLDPLAMNSAGFGGTGTPGEIDQPWPHGDNGAPKRQNGPAMDNPPVMGPAGRVHCSISDWAKFVQDQLRGAQGKEGTLLKSDSYTKLHTPVPGADYALGWGVTQRDWGGGTVLHHGGDNTMNHANVWIAPNRDFAILACVNQGGDTAFKASDDAVGAMIGLIQSSAAASE